MESDDWWVVKQWATQHRHITFAKVSSLGVDITSKEKTVIDQDRILPYSSRIASSLCEWIRCNRQTLSQHYYWLFKEQTVRIYRQKSVINSATTLCCHNWCLDFKIGTMEPIFRWSWYRTRNRQTTKETTNIHKKEHDPYCTEYHYRYALPTTDAIPLNQTFHQENVQCYEAKGGYVDRYQTARYEQHSMKNMDTFNPVNIASPIVNLYWLLALKTTS